MPLGSRPEPRVVGSASPETKRTAQREIVERFGEGHFDSFTEKELSELKDVEIEKSPEQIEEIRVANELTNELLEKFGLRGFDIPLDNIHFIKGEHLEKIGSGGLTMTTVPKLQAIIVNASYYGKKENSTVAQALTMFHETVHLKGHFSLRIKGEDKTSTDRSGLVIHNPRKEKDSSDQEAWFDGLNEAVVTQIEAEYKERILGDNSFLKEQVEYLKSEESQNLAKDFAQKRGISEEDIEWIGRDGEEIEVFMQGYHPQRQMLNYVVDQIYADGGFASRQEVMDIFFAAHFKNSILPIGRLLEKTFGKGSFEFLGRIGRDADSPSVQKAMDFLMERRKQR